MSYTSIPQKVQWDTWLRAGGRCEYRGCNEALWRDNLTLAVMNRAYLAHIVADSPNGPRGDAQLSEQLKADPTNIMLLCDAHHRLIDKVDVAGYTVELLRRHKRDHEERIARQTGLQPNLRTHIVMLSTRIADRRGWVSYDQACQAVSPSRYPADETGIRLTLADNQVDEGDREFWDSPHISMTIQDQGGNRSTTYRSLHWHRFPYSFASVSDSGTLCRRMSTSVTATQVTGAGKPLVTNASTTVLLGPAPTLRTSLLSR